MGEDLNQPGQRCLFQTSADSNKRRFEANLEIGRAKGGERRVGAPHAGRHPATGVPFNGFRKEERKNIMGTILFIILILLLIGALPTWGYSKSWGIYPSGGIGLVLLILIILLLTGRI
jgi:hypothetical protein